MRRIILECDLSLGDIVMLTAAVRDLHLTYPGQFETDVRTPFPDLWEGNPYITPLSPADRSVETIYCQCPLIHRSNEAPYHFLHAFIEFLNDRLGLSIKVTRSSGDLHLLPTERTAPSRVAELVGAEIPYWIIVAGGKYDYTIKWWSARRYQEVVDHFRGRIQFVQVGGPQDYHPTLDGVLDLTGRTTVRELLRLVYRAQGVLCGVTSLMHLAAAVPCHSPRHITRPCVVVAGGREPTVWEAYPHHQFIHTVGALPCCRDGGCWKSRTFALGDGSELDHPESLCSDVVGSLPRCMHMISSAEVIQRVERYFEGGAVAYLNADQAGRARAPRESSLPRRSRGIEDAPAAAEQFLEQTPAPPRRSKGRGIALCASAEPWEAVYVGVRLLRHLGCELPVELWHDGKREPDAGVAQALAPLGVQVRSTSAREQERPCLASAAEIGLGLFALAHSAFREVLLLDAPTLSTVNPQRLFESPEYRQHRAVFWPGPNRLDSHRSIWRLCGLEPQDVPSCEAYPVLLDRVHTWKALNLGVWMARQGDLFAHHLEARGDGLPMAFRKLGFGFATPEPTASRGLTPRDAGPRFHPGFTGQHVFQTTPRKFWTQAGPSWASTGLLHADTCAEFLEDFRRLRRPRSLNVAIPRA